jgi:hypothetical protein
VQGDGPINNVVTQLNREYSDVQFQLFCAHLKTFLQWESLEGTPYMYMREVNRPVSMASLTTYADSNVEPVAKELLKRVLQLPVESIKKCFKVTVGQNKVEAVTTDDAEQMFADWFKNWQSWNGIAGNLIYRQSGNITTGIFAYKKSNGEYVSSAVSNAPVSAESLGYQKTPILHFKKEPVYFKIISENNFQVQKELYVNPQFSRKVSELFSKHLTLKAIELKRAEARSASGSEQQAAKSDSTPL